MSFLTTLKNLVVGQSSKKQPTGPTERELIEQESNIGRELFGPIPAGHSRDFFCLDEKTWVWHEIWKDEHGKQQTSTIRYEIQQNGILKVLPGRVYHYIEGEELTNLYQAIRLYYDRVAADVYGFDPTTGRPLSTPA